MEVLEVRKTQKVGHSTLSITLPKKWTSEVGLKRGDAVTLRSEGRILSVYPGSTGVEPATRDCTIDGEECREPGMLYQAIVGSYMMGFDSITVESKRPLSVASTENLHQAVQSLLGAGIVEQHPNRVVIQNFIDPSKFSIPLLAKRLHTLLDSMLRTLIDNVYRMDAQVATDIGRSKMEAARVYNLIVRQLLSGIQDRSAARRMEVDSPTIIVGGRVVCRNLAAIAECLENIANALLGLASSKKPPSKKNLEALTELLTNTRVAVEKGYGAVYAGDFLQASLVSKGVQALEAAAVEAWSAVQKTEKDPRVSSLLTFAIAEIRDIAKFVEGMREIAVNHSLLKSSRYVDIH